MEWGTKARTPIRDELGGTMRICLSHRTALGYLLRVPNVGRGASRTSRARAVPRACPPDQDARRLFEALSPNLPEDLCRLDVLVSSPSGCHRTDAVRPHLCTTELPAGSFIAEVTMGLGFHVSAPELVFLQMAEELELDQLVYVGFALCSAFRLDDLELGGCAHREGRDEPLTTVARIRAYLDRLPRGTRNIAVARRALEHVRDGARSLSEAGIAMAVGLPVRLGGHALGETRMNHELRVYDGVDSRGQARWVTRVPDVLVTARDRSGEVRRVGIDFDALSTHGSPERSAADVERRNLMAPDGRFTHFTLTSGDVSNYVAFRRALDRVRRSLGQREKPRLTGNRDSADNQRLLAETWSRQFDLWNRVLGPARIRL